MACTAVLRTTRPVATPHMTSSVVSRSPFGALVTLFYGPLFAVIGALNAALAKLPPIPAAALRAPGKGR